MIAQHLSFAISLILTLSGVWMQWHMPEYRMSAEEAVKDRRIPEERIEERMRLLKTVARLLIVSGVVLLVASITWMAE